jgi:hypothetical protein
MTVCMMFPSDNFLMVVQRCPAIFAASSELSPALYIGFAFCLLRVVTHGSFRFLSGSTRAKRDRLRVLHCEMMHPCNDL